MQCYVQAEHLRPNSCYYFLLDCKTTMSWKVNDNYTTAPIEKAKLTCIKLSKNDDKNESVIFNEQCRMMLSVRCITQCKGKKVGCLSNCKSNQPGINSNITYSM